MPMCDVCHTYYSHKPCPTCQPKQKISNAFKVDTISTKVFLTAPTVNELDFMWAQVSKKTIQRVQSGGQVLRQGFFDIQIDQREIQFEWIGSTFNHGFYSRLERLYPGTETIIVLCDIIAQNFNFDSFKDLLNDLINVNKRSLKNFFLIWLEPYLNSQNQYEQYKTIITGTFNEYLTDRDLSIEIKEFTFPLYSTERFTWQLKNLLSQIMNDNSLGNEINSKLPLRPLFRTQRPFLDPNAPNRVIILNLERSSFPEPKNSVKINLNEKVENIKCLACSKDVKSDAKVCIICNFTFCSSCIAYLNNENENDEIFCLGSIYHGIHRFTFTKN